MKKRVLVDLYFGTLSIPKWLDTVIVCVTGGSFISLLFFLFAILATDGEISQKMITGLLSSIPGSLVSLAIIFGHIVMTDLRKG